MTVSNSEHGAVLCTCHTRKANAHLKIGVAAVMSGMWACSQNKEETNFLSAFDTDQVVSIYSETLSLSGSLSSPARDTVKGQLFAGISDWSQIDAAEYEVESEPTYVLDFDLGWFATNLDKSETISLIITVERYNHSPGYRVEMPLHGEMSGVLEPDQFEVIYE